MTSAERSVEVILAGQSPSGAFHDCGLRDGAFVADAMREAGYESSADRFFDWVARLEEPWATSPREGLGLTLGAFRRAGRWNEVADRIAEWLGEHWHEPCLDWWGERHGVHAATLWAVGNGVRSDEIKREALARADDRLDASLLLIGTPELVERVETQLVSPEGGVWRNLDDARVSIPLTAMLGLAYVDHGRLDDADRCLAWIEARELPDLWSHAMHLRLCQAVTHG